MNLLIHKTCFKLKSVVLFLKIIQFLDLNVKLSGNKLSTDLCIKSTDRHQYLHYTSSHPEHTKKPVVYSQALRLSRICMEEKDFDKHICEMKSWFSQSRKTQTRKNSKQLKLEKLNFLVTVSYVAKVEKGVPLVVTCLPPYLNPLAKLFMITFIYYTSMKN